MPQGWSFQTMNTGSKLLQGDGKGYSFAVRFADEKNFSELSIHMNLRLVSDDIALSAGINPLEKIPHNIKHN